MPDSNSSALEAGEATSRRAADEPLARVKEAGRNVLARYDQALRPGAYLPAGPTTFAGIVPYEEINPRSLPPARVVTRYNFIAGNYLIAPHVLTGEPVAVLYYKAYRTKVGRNEWVIGPDSIEEFRTNANIYEWLAMLLEYADTTNNQALLNRLSAVHETAEEGKTIVERLQKIYESRRGRKPTRRGSAVSLLADLVLSAGEAGLAVARGRERKRHEEAMVRLTEGAKDLGIEPFVVHRGEQLDIGPGPHQVHTVRFRTVFIDVRNIEARVEARKNVLRYCESRLNELDDIRPNRIIRKRFKWIRDTLEKEIELLEQGGHGMVRPGGEVNIYWLLNIDSTAREMIEGK